MEGCYQWGLPRFFLKRLIFSQTSVLVATIKDFYTETIIVDNLSLIKFVKVFLKNQNTQPSCTWLVQKYFTMTLSQNHGTICEKPEGGSWWMEPLVRFPRVHNGVLRENIEGPSRDFPRAKPKVNTEEDLQYSPEGLHENSRDLPKGFIHHDSPEGFSQIFILTMYWTSSRARRRYCAWAGRQEASCQAERRVW